MGFINKFKAKFKRQVYADNASCTKPDKSVLKVIREAENLFANPGSLHRPGVLARQKIEYSRSIVAGFIGAHSDEVIFTTSGTESDSLAILGVIEEATIFGIEIPHIIICEIEHSAILDLVKKLEQKNKIKVSYLKVDENGLINPKNVFELIGDDTVLISVHLVNNEIGTLEPVKEIAKIVRQYKKLKNQTTYPLVHTDAAQATAYISININQLGVDLLSFNGQKMYGPKGVGVLFVKRNTPIKIAFRGTEALPQIAGLAQACKITKLHQQKDFDNLTNLREYFIEKLETEFKNICSVHLYAKNVLVSPHILNVTFKNIASETLILYLDARGIYVTGKSACKSGEPGESHVLEALKRAKMNEYKEGSVRFSFGRETKKSDVDYIIKSLKEIFKILNIN